MGNIITSIKMKQKKRLRERRLNEKLKAQEQLALKQNADGGVSSSMCCIDNPGNIEDFYFIEKDKIGEGSYGRVCRCSNKSTGAPRAVKMLRKVSKLSEVAKFRREIILLRMLDHPHVAKLFEHFEDSSYMFMVMQLCAGGELFDRMMETGHFTEGQTAIIMQQIIRAVFYLHSQSVAHRDLKMENIMLMSEGAIEQNTVKLIDFGSARTFEEGEFMSTKVGTPYFVAPQVLAGRYTEACDIWTIGVVMYCLLCGYPPFFGDSDAEVLARVRVGTFYFNAADWKHVSDYAKTMIKNMLRLNPADRISAKQALQDEWLDKKAPRLRAPLKLRYLDNMRNFGPMNLLKKATLQIMAAQLDEEYTKPLVETFQWLDDSGEGTISAAELREGLVKSGVPETDIPEDLEHMVKQIDTDGTGEIEITEFVASTLDPRLYTKEEFCWAAFRIFDQNCDGKIGVRELRDIMNNGQIEEKVSKEVCKGLIGDVDEDGDMEVDFNEFMHMMHGTTQKKVMNQNKTAYERKVEEAHRAAMDAMKSGDNPLDLVQSPQGMLQALTQARQVIDEEEAARLKAEEEAKMKAEEEAKRKAEREAKLKAEKEAKEEAKKAEEKAKKKDEEEQGKKTAEQQASPLQQGTAPQENSPKNKVRMASGPALAAKSGTGKINKKLSKEDQQTPSDARPVTKSGPVKVSKKLSNEDQKTPIDASPGTKSTPAKPMLASKGPPRPILAKSPTKGKVSE
mmetsp:Transcript_26036/g.65701  ORF Transcript_26036/g.65701 Transcript_26036/m.65701 type:complete len:735 (-) Transcript_26036:68-2272(-)|eukprot:CAMPEP_0115461754 /NCGR_PEP_ID=MMETSP0271-20121206/47468_1 /TAXON_ID=71861 /ORGANISM="Scrippsiella trochoidea, Strain CCMP3099" /LENGTH=734 /DNA_ID=CAMNT_0002888513 /DNA_START=44 /DNA_END=2248 /DNA_ORIENTATION=-